MFLFCFCFRTQKPELNPKPPNPAPHFRWTLPLDLPSVGQPSAGQPSAGQPSAGPPKISLFFSPPPATIFILFFSLWGSFRGILVVFEAPRPSKTPTKFHERTPRKGGQGRPWGRAALGKGGQRNEERRNLWREEAKKARNFGPPTLRGPTLRGPTFQGPTFSRFGHLGPCFLFCLSFLIFVPNVFFFCPVCVFFFCPNFFFFPPPCLLILSRFRFFCPGANPKPCPQT